MASTNDVGSHSLPAGSMPALSPAGGTYATGQPVTVSSSVAGATIRYTVNGNDPTTNGTMRIGRTFS